MLCEVNVFDFVSESGVGVEFFGDAVVPFACGLGVELVDFARMDEDVEWFVAFEFLSEFACVVSVKLFDSILDGVDDVWDCLFSISRCVKRIK